MATLRPGPVWQRTSPKPGSVEGPVVYQLLFNTAGTPNTIAKFDNNPRHLTNSSITDSGTMVAIGGLSINSSSGIISFSGGQTFPNSGLPAAGGDLSGTLSSATVVGLQGRPVSSAAPSIGQALLFSGTAWSPAAIPAWLLGGNSGTSAGTNYIGTNDNQPFEVHVGANGRAFRIEPQVDTTGSNFPAPNVIGGFSGNSAGAFGATIAGGGETGSPNMVNTSYGFGTVGGGAGNTASNGFATVAGGYRNTAGGFYGTASGGAYNSAGASGATISGGLYNSAGNDSTVTGGYSNAASGNGATVDGGQSNTASGVLAAVVGGWFNKASGDYSFAAGVHANTNGHQGALVWGDNSTATDVTATVDNQFVARVSGGAIFYSNSALTAGVSLAAGGSSWLSLSDRNAKANFAPVDFQQVLAKLVAMPVTTWNYKSQASTIRHMGPMAQDFYSAFHIGEDNKHLSEIDEAGVAFAAIQGLNEKVEQKIGQLEHQIKQRDALLAQQREQVERLQAALESQRAVQQRQMTSLRAKIKTLQDLLEQRNVSSLVQFARRSQQFRVEK